MQRTWLRTGAIAAAGVFALGTAAPAAATHPAAQGWIEQDPAQADTTGAVAGGGGLRALPGTEPTASLHEAGGTPAAQAVFPPRDLGRPADAVEVEVGVEGSGDVLVEARGAPAGGAWGEWRAAGAGDGRVRVELAQTAERVQLRVGLGSDTAEDGAVLTSARLRPVGEPSPGGRTGPERPYSARLFATRIGLVGAGTANGHTVRPDDHFVALPSRRGLAEKDGGEYSVRVCTEGEDRRCAYAPVWDVGPWNIRDDHWNADREEWGDLPQGTPQAQAAFNGGHNGGRDGFGRTVANPAGIDLADGTFNDALALETNAWVRVDYLWTGRPDPRARVTTATAADPVRVRSGPGIEYPETGLAAHAAEVPVACSAAGDAVSGPGGSSDRWYRIGNGDYIPAAFTGAGGEAEAAPDCDAPPLP